ncbi:DUF4395 family protein [Rhodococcus opacus]|nr:DUF4395 family protein [Rhodococcus opacus]
MSTTPATTPTTSTTTAVDQVDVRGPRFAACITTAVLVAVLLAASFSAVVGGVILAVQTVVFAVSAAVGPRRSPYGRIFGKLVAPRISPPSEREPTAPLRFAQLVGFIFSAAGLLGFALSAPVVGCVFTGFALFAAFLNAAFGICLGCQIYPLVARFRPSASADHPTSDGKPRQVHSEGKNMARSDVLVSTDWAQQNLNAPNVVFVEVDEDTSAYDIGHIEGAVKLDWKKDLQDQVRRDFLDREQFSALLSARGIANDDEVVLYGGNNNWFAAYAYWYFKLYGHDNVKLLDGGRKKWELEERPLSEDTVTRPTSTYRASEPDLSIRAFRDEAVDAIGVLNLVDVRSPDEFTGKILAPAHLPQEQSQRPGHIPGALNVPWSKAANEDGTFKSDEELTAIYGEAGLDGSRDTIAYCRIGERSSHTWFVLKELLGHKNVKNYDGSWTEYGSLVGVPIELGK